MNMSDTNEKDAPYIIYHNKVDLDRALEEKRTHYIGAVLVEDETCPEGCLKVKYQIGVTKC